MAKSTAATSSCRPYRWLARYYDTIFPSGGSWGEPARSHILEPVLPGVHSACDLACGTGSTAVMLAARGIRTYAVDLSAEMCRLARAKARREGVALRVIHADMRFFRLPEAVDLVSCEFDAINHLPGRSELGKAVAAVAQALKPGGFFYFDVNSRLSFRKLWPLTWWIDKPDVAAVMHGGYDPAADKAWSQVEWFVREGPLWRRRRERVEQVCWSGSEIRSTLRAAGFDRIRAWDATRFFQQDTALRRGYRTFYLARKSVPRSGSGKASRSGASGGRWAVGGRFGAGGGSGSSG